MTAQRGNILVPLLAIVALISLSAAGYFYWQNQQLQNLPITQIGNNYPTPVITPTPTLQDETANWKTYTDQRYSFSFKYPQEYSVWQDTPDSNKDQVSLLVVTDYVRECLEKPGSCPLGHTYGTLQIIIYPIDSPIADLKKWVRDKHELPGSVSTNLLDIKEISPTDNLKDGISFHNTAGIGDGEYNWAFYDPTQKFIIEFFHWKPIEQEPVATQILSTFKFL